MRGAWCVPPKPPPLSLSDALTIAVANGSSQLPGGATRGSVGSRAVEWFGLEDTSGGLWSTTQPRQGQLQRHSVFTCSVIYRKLSNVIEGGKPLRFSPSFAFLNAPWVEFSSVQGCISLLTLIDKCFFQCGLWCLLNVPVELLIYVLLVSVLQPRAGCLHSLTIKFVPAFWSSMLGLGIINLSNRCSNCLPLSLIRFIHVDLVCE